MSSEQTPENIQQLANTLGSMSKFCGRIGALGITFCLVKAGFEVEDSMQAYDTVRTAGTVALATGVSAGGCAVIQRELELKAIAMKQNPAGQQG